MKKRIVIAVNLVALMTASLLDTSPVVHAESKPNLASAQTANPINVELPPFTARLLDELSGKLS